MTKANSGFTLIELISVVLIMGLLLATVAPRFMNLSKDAKIATVKAFSGSQKSAVYFLHLQAQIQGKISGSDIVLTDYGPYDVWQGYPETRSEATNPANYLVETFIDLGSEPDSETKGANREATHGNVRVYETNSLSRIGYPKNNTDTTLINGKCYAEYAQSGTGQGISLETDGC